MGVYVAEFSFSRLHPSLGPLAGICKTVTLSLWPFWTHEKEEDEYIARCKANHTHTASY